MAENSEEIVSGITVKLRSGGRLMTTGILDERNDSFRCYWFDSAGVFHKESIDRVALTKADSEDSRQFAAS